MFSGESEMRNRLMGRGEKRIFCGRTIGVRAMCLALAAMLALTAAASDDSSGLPMLPSGLPVVSTASAGRDMIAIDAMGSLFASHDRGRNWKAVERQWQGRAKKVRLTGTASPFAPPAFRAKKSARAGAALAVFELVNDANAVWTSADGVKWAAE